MGGAIPSVACCPIPRNAGERFIPAVLYPLAHVAVDLQQAERIGHRCVGRYGTSWSIRLGAAVVGIAPIVIGAIRGNLRSKPERRGWAGARRAAAGDVLMFGFAKQPIGRPGLL